MVRAVNPSYGDEPPMLLDWLPWSHTVRRQQQFQPRALQRRLVLYRRRQPVPGAIEATVKNLREISPTVYYNVPRGFEMLLPFLTADEGSAQKPVRETAVVRLCGRGAAAPCARGIRAPRARDDRRSAPMLTSLGSTETGPSAMAVTEKACAPGVVGIPNPGVEVKLAPNGDKLEARLKSPSITPGYWRQPELTRAAFDEEGYYKHRRRAALLRRERARTRPRVRRPRGGGFQARDRHLGQRRPAEAQIVAHCAPYVTDVVVAGHDRDDATALVVPNLATCRELAGLDGAASETDALAHPKVRENFSALLAAFNRSAGGSSGRFARLILMDDPPSLDTGEPTDKGSINQRAVLARRAEMVEELYAETPSPRTIV